MTSMVRHGHGRGEELERLTRQEELILDVTVGLSEALEDKGVTKAELARRLDRTPSFVSQLFAGSRNLTLRTIADVAAALSLRPSFVLSPEAQLIGVMPGPRAPPVEKPAPGGKQENVEWLRRSDRLRCPSMGWYGIAGIRTSGPR